MVDLATFRTFPRASPGRQSEALVAEPDVSVEKGILTDEALPKRFSQELRARRRAARTDMRQSEAWAEPEIVQPQAPPAPEPVDVASAPPDLSDVPEPEAEVHEPPELFAAEPSAPVAVREDTVPDPFVPHAEPAAPIAETSFAEPEHMLPSPPVPIDEFLAEPVAPFEVPAPVITNLFESAEPAPVEHEASLADERPPNEEGWPLGEAEAMLVEPPTPPEPGVAALLGLASEPEMEELSLEEARPAPTLRQLYSSESLALDYRLLGLANPLVVTVTGRLGDAMPMHLTIGRTGIYRPDGFRPAPWSGFAYDISPDGRTGLVLGTRILTSRGEIPVEDLVPGDTALALRGPALLPIVWIGRSIAVSPPVEIAADAFGPGRPGKTLRVGADHPIFMQTMPIPARDLVNGDTIRTLDTETAELFHIDVGFAEVLLAEGVPLSSGCR